MYARLCQVAEEWIVVIHEERQELPRASSSKKFSGKFVVRVEPSIHRRIALRAKAEGESLNTFIAKALRRA